MELSSLSLSARVQREEVDIWNAHEGRVHVEQTTTCFVQLELIIWGLFVMCNTNNRSQAWATEEAICLLLPKLEMLVERCTNTFCTCFYSWSMCAMSAPSYNAIFWFWPYVVWAFNFDPNQASSSIPRIPMLIEMTFGVFFKIFRFHFGYGSTKSIAMEKPVKTTKGEIPSHDPKGIKK